MDPSVRLSVSLSVPQMVPFTSSKDQNVTVWGTLAVPRIAHFLVHFTVLKKRNKKISKHVALSVIGAYSSPSGRIRQKKSLAAGYGRHAMPSPGANDIGTTLGQNGSD